MVPSFEKRVRAFAIDTSGVSLVAMISVFGVVPFNELLGTVLIILGAVGFYVLPYAFGGGQTLGKRVQKIKIVMKDDSKASIIILVLRDAFKLGLSIATFGLYLIVATFAMSGHVSRTIHDYIFQTKVIDLEPQTHRDHQRQTSSLLKERGL
jgi:uncharacterized RDD family membrane protein YckC